MLNFDGGYGETSRDRDILIDKIYRWCVERTRSGEGYPLRGSDLALAYKKSV